MKILHTVESYYPSVGGMQEVVRQLSERLVRLGHEVVVATSAHSGRTFTELNGVRIESFALGGNLVRGIEGAEDEVRRYQRFVKDTSFDVVTNFAAQQWATDLVLSMLDEVPAKKVFVPTGFPGLEWPGYEGYFGHMASWLHGYDMNVFLSNDYRDINFARQSGVTNIAVIPNGAGEDEFLPIRETDIREKLGIPSDYFLILHVGSHTGRKGHREAIQIFERAGLKKAALLIVANSFGKGCTRSCARRGMLFGWSPRRPLDRKRLVITPLSRDDTVAAYQQADLFLFPSNIECSPIVLFECAASKTPFLVTDVGNSAEIVRWTYGGAILPTEKDDRGLSHAQIGPSALMLAQFYGDAALRAEMASAGYASWRRRFSWEVVASVYDRLYRTLE